MFRHEGHTQPFNDVPWHVFRGDNIDGIYYGLCEHIHDNPDRVVAPRDLHTKELLNVTTIIDALPHESTPTLPARNTDLRYLVGEFCWHLNQSDRLTEIGHYSKFWDKVSDDGYTVRSAYGKRLIPQLPYVIGLLSEDPTTRKAVMVIYDKSDQRKSKDNPCTMYLRFYIQNDFLYMETHMRSNDIWFGFTYDVPFFQLIHEIVATMTGLDTGPYIHKTDSLHMYERNEQQVEQLLAGPTEQEPYARPLLTKMDTGLWFSYLRDVEYLNRINRSSICRSIPSSSFQDWAVERLKR